MRQTLKMVYKVNGNGIFLWMSSMFVFAFSSKWKKGSSNFSVIFVKNENADIPLYCFIEVVIF